LPGLRLPHHRAVVSVVRPGRHGSAGGVVPSDEGTPGQRDASRAASRPVSASMDSDRPAPSAGPLPGPTTGARRYERGGPVRAARRPAPPSRGWPDERAPPRRPPPPSAKRGRVSGFGQRSEAGKPASTQRRPGEPGSRPSAPSPVRLGLGASPHLRPSAAVPATAGTVLARSGVVARAPGPARPSLSGSPPAERTDRLLGGQIPARDRRRRRPGWRYSRGAMRWTASADVMTGNTSKSTRSLPAAIHWSRRRRSSHSISW